MQTSTLLRQADSERAQRTQRRGARARPVAPRYWSVDLQFESLAAQSGLEVSSKRFSLPLFERPARTSAAVASFPVAICWNLHSLLIRQGLISRQIASEEMATAIGRPCQTWFPTWIPATETECLPGFWISTGPPEYPSNTLQESNKRPPSLERPTKWHWRSAVIRYGVCFAYPGAIKLDAVAGLIFCSISSGRVAALGSPEINNKAQSLASVSYGLSGSYAEGTW